MRFCVLALLSAVVVVDASAQGLTVEQAMDDIVTRLYDTMSLDELDQLTEEQIHEFLTPEERDALATKYWHFDVNVPVVVSVMRETDQRRTPFWLPEAGFEKTDMTVTNTQNWTYEVWQKKFPAGPIGLGINGFGKHRPHYFVTVGPQDAGDELELSNVFPGEFPIVWAHEGAYVYNDWDGLLLKDVPEALEGDLLLTTIRGRAREAHLIGGFRRTPFPAKAAPHQVLLTWAADPQTTQTVQWRTSTETKDGAVQYWRVGEEANTKVVEADRTVIEDRFLANDRFCHRFTATIPGLEPDTAYGYRVGTRQKGLWSESKEFRTAPAEVKPFTFVSFGDTHISEEWGDNLERTLERHPETAFYTIAGDLVKTGQYRDDWDQFFALGEGEFDRRPLAPALGNHDIIDGLGAGMWKAVFELPKNGPESVESERAYTIEYSNLLLLVLDSGLPAVEQAAWIEEQLSESDATWKIAVFHFPPYNHEHPYPEIKSLWGYLFNKHGLDIALNGHFHSYMRSHPICQGEPQTDGGDGTIYLMSIAISGRQHALPPAPWAAVQFTGPALYQTFDVDGDTLTVRAWDSEGNVRDEFRLEK